MLAGKVTITVVSLNSVALEKSLTLELQFPFWKGMEVGRNCVADH